MNNRLGRQTVTFDNPPIIIETASTVGQKEGKGPLKSTFDVILDDDTLGEKSWEKSESMLQKKTALLALEKAKLQQSDIDYILAGDLLNQCVGAHYSVRDFDIPFLGLYGACSTMTESMSIGSMIVSAGFADYAMCLTSSHFCSSEIQFRNPLEYGGQRTPSAQWTVTGAGCAILSSKGTGPKITHVTTGKVIDKGVTDISNMGAAMAPAAIDTLIAHFNDTHRTPDYYDMILTGDLGVIGSDILVELMLKEGFDILESILGTESFRRYVHVLLTDRGTEFSAAEAMETSSDGTRRTRVFYCDPMQSGQKGTLENKHIELRYILPKGTDLKELGLTCQSSLNLVLSHVNSSPCELLGSKSPLELTEFMYQDLYEKLLAFGIHPIDKDQIILKPYLLKQRNK